MSSYGQVYASQIASTVPLVTVLQNNATGNGDGASLNVEGYASCVLNITASGMGGGTAIWFEASVDDTSWVAILGTEVSTGASGTSTTSAGDWAFNIACYKSIRARIASYGSGTINVHGYASVLYGLAGSGGGGGNVNLYQINGTTVSQGNGTAGNGCQRVTVASDNTAFATICSGAAKGGTSAASATVTSVDSDHNALDVYVRGGGSGGGDIDSITTSVTPGTLSQHLGKAEDAPHASGDTGVFTLAVRDDLSTKFCSDNGDFSPLAVTKYGVLKVQIEPSQKPTFLYVCNYTTPANATADIFMLPANSSRTVKVLYVSLTWAVEGSGAGGDIYLYRRTDTSSSAGTDVNAVALDSDFSTTTTAKVYTANPTPAGSESLIMLANLKLTGQNSMTNGKLVIWDANAMGQALCLKAGSTESLVVNCNGVKPTGSNQKFSVCMLTVEEY